MKSRLQSFLYEERIMKLDTDFVVLENPVSSCIEKIETVLYDLGD